MQSERINKKTLDVKSTKDEIGLTDIDKTVYPTTAKYTLFSSAHGIFSKIDHVLGLERSLRKFKRI